LLAAAPAAPAGLERPYYITPRAGATHLNLSNDWQLSWRDTQISSPRELASQSKWITVANPTSVHMALYQAGELPHPYYNLNSHQYRWVAEKAWYYRKSIQAPAIPAGHFAFLCFDGINYFARVWLNGALLGDHEGMFGGPNVEVSQLLKPGSNEIIVEVRAANWGHVEEYKQNSRLGLAAVPWIFTGGSGAEDFFVLGMWQGVRLEVLPSAHLERPFLVTESLSPTEAHLRLTGEVFSSAHSNQYQLHPWDNSILQRFQDSTKVKPASQPLSVEFTLRDPRTGAAAFRRVSPVEAFQGRNWFQQRYTIPQPKLWWPNGMGDPFLYQVQITLLEAGKPVDTISFDFGIRTLQTVQTPTRRTLDFWNDWQFLVNGRKFFVKGINWMPADLLLDLPASRYEWLTDLARNAGFQMLRVWGGGLVETDEFYRQCDRRGLLVWQDFPLSNMVAPKLGLEMWESQVVQNVFRLRNHAALAVWCGGNESNAYATGNAGAIGVFERSVIEFDPGRPYKRTSPDAGGLHQYPDMDPTWYGKMYRYVPFMAETGMHNIPEARSMREVVSAKEFEQPLSNMYSDEFAAAHPDFRHHFAEFSPSRVPRMLSRASQIADMRAPTIEDLAEASQIGASEFYQILSEQLQANYPATTGLLPWTFKRPWPVIAIMLADGFGHPTAPYYALKRTYEATHAALTLPEILWTPGEQIPLRAAVTHASPTPLAGHRLQVEVFDPSLKSVWKKSLPVAIAAGPSVTQLDLGSYPIPQSFRNAFFFLTVELRNAQGALVSRSVYWPRCPALLESQEFRDKYRAAPQPNLTFDQGPWLKPAVANTQTTLTLTAGKPAAQPGERARLTLRVRNTGAAPAFPVHLEIDGAKRAFFATDNYFWLAPGEEKSIQVDVLWRELPAGKPIQVSAQAWNAPTAATALQP
jgi:beta-mannosidase